MANGSFEEHVAKLIEARAKGLHHADLIFAMLAQDGHWTANYARRVWDASRPPPRPPRPPGAPRPPGDDEDDDIPF